MEDEDHEGALGGKGRGGGWRGWFNPSTNFLIPQLQSGSLWDQYEEIPVVVASQVRLALTIGHGDWPTSALPGGGSCYTDLSSGWRKRGRGYASSLVNRDRNGLEKDSDRY